MPGIILSSSEGTEYNTLEVECERAAGLAGADESSNMEVRCVPLSAIVVHVRDWDACEHSLATC